MSDVNATLVPRDHHPVSRKLISDNALKVMYRLNSKGYDAYLVGGGVRDILMGQQPKDFDIATNAHPEQVKRLFSNSRLIGRRFKLVHILFGRDIIEVATFRGQAESAQKQENSQHGQSQNKQHQHKQSEDGMLLRDNVYGTIEEDAVRRDFTVNALYYSTQDFCIYDFVDSMKDIEARQLRLIGDPETRYREDPVRMLRAIRFSAKLDFDIETSTRQPIKQLASLMGNVSAARLFDEVIKLFVSGYGVRIFDDLVTFGLFEAMFPHVSHTIESDEDAEFYQRFIRAGLENTDARIRQDKPITPAFLYATLLWPEVDRLWRQFLEEGMSDFPALQRAGQIALQDQLPHITIPKRFALMMKEIWEYQIRLTKTHGKRPFELVAQKRFRAAYDFLLLREQAGENLGGLGSWWTKFQEQNPAPQHNKEPSRRDGTKKPGTRTRRPSRRRQG